MPESKALELNQSTIEEVFSLSLGGLVPDVFFGKNGIRELGDAVFQFPAANQDIPRDKKLGGRKDSDRSFSFCF